MPSCETGVAVELQTETWSDFYKDAQFIFPIHWRELALNQDEIKIDVDLDGYLNMERLGRLLVITARSSGRLVGYFISFLMHHLHYKSTGTMAITDMYYVLPAYRNGTGMRLFIEWERILRERGVAFAMTSCKLHQDHQVLFEKLGWTFSDKTFVKYLRR